MSIDTRKMRYTRDAMAAFKVSNLEYTEGHSCNVCGEVSPATAGGRPETLSDRIWSKMEHSARALKTPSRNIGQYPFTSVLATWASNAMVSYKPDDEVLQLVEPFSAEFHSVVDEERSSSSGLHDLNVIEFTYQVTLEVGAAVLLAADATDDPVEIQDEFHTSRAGADDHFSSWGRLLTGLECDPPIIAQFPVYLYTCQAFTFESKTTQEDMVYAALTGVDWAKGSNQFSDKLELFEKRARAAVPNLEDIASGQDRSFWRIAQAYLRAMNRCENSRSFKAPRRAAIPNQMSHDLLMAMRGLDTIGSAYMCSDGAAFLDNAGMDSLIGSAVPNDIMDLHTDIKTGETRNSIRLLYPDGLDINQTMKTVSTILSGMLCELFRGHCRARFSNREDGRIAATSPAYSFCRARHRKIFEVMEKYETRYPQFWDWTWEIYRMAKEQVTDAGLKEPLICSMKRAVKQEALPPSPVTTFYDTYYELVERTVPLNEKSPLGVSPSLSEVTKELNSLWHVELLATDKEPGWGRRFDLKSDTLFGEVGRILSESGKKDDMYKFAIAYGRLSMALPYIAYHTVDAIIMAFGIEE